MTTTIELPLWLVLAGGMLAGVALFVHFALPGTRWFLRRRADRVIEDVGARLDLELPPFLLTRREALVDRLTYDPQVMALTEQVAAERDVPRHTVISEVESYAREIVPGFNAYFYFRIGFWMARRFIRFFYRVRIGYADEPALANVRSGRTSIVMVMNHRSNFDYVLVTYLASRRATISYAAGEWTCFWPFGNLLRAMGAYFVRRGSDNPLYRKVLERYVQMAVAGRVPQGVYPEGGLSRDGRVQSPKLGILDYMVRDFDPDGDRDIVFMPIGINYERVVEDYRLIADDGEAGLISQKGTRFVVQSVAMFFLRNLWGMAFDRRRRFGRACANFGTPVSLKAWLAEHGVDPRGSDKASRIRWVKRLADSLMSDVEALVPVLPVSLLATVFADNPARSMGELEIKARAHELIGRFSRAGAHLYIPWGEENLAISDGLHVLRRRGMVITPEDGRFQANGARRDLLNFYANPVRHFLEDSHRKAA